MAEKDAPVSPPFLPSLLREAFNHLLASVLGWEDNGLLFADKVPTLLGPVSAFLSPRPCSPRPGVPPLLVLYQLAVTQGARELLGLDALYDRAPITHPDCRAGHVGCTHAHARI